MHEFALIFDFGNVVAHFDYLKVSERFGARLGVSAQVFRQKILERGFAEQLNRFESGRIAPEEFAAETMAMAGLDLSYAEFVADWQDMFWLNEPVARLIEHLKSLGYRLLLGSNTNVLHAAHYRRQFAATLNLLDRLVLSYEVGHLKPDIRFYQACVAASERPARSCLFIDDLEENVEGARRAGLIGLHYVDTPTLIADLGRHGIEVATGER
jgi:putative hydrolase of the HAD superfamily